MILTGYCRLGRDAELRSTTNGDSVANLSLAFNYGQKDNSGKKPSQWVDASLWGKRAESLVEYLVKGQGLVVVLEDPHIETFKTRDGTPGSKLVARVASLDFAGDAPAAAPPPPQRQAREPAPAPRPTAASRPPTAFDDMDDDVPF